MEELRLFERVVSHWPAFAPALEGSMCSVVRIIQTALAGQCKMAKGPALPDAASTVGSQGYGQYGSGPTTGAGAMVPEWPQGAGHQRSASAIPGPLSQGMQGGGGNFGIGPGGPRHQRSASSAASQFSNQQHGYSMGPLGTRAGPGAALYPPGRSHAAAGGPNAGNAAAHGNRAGGTGNQQPSQRLAVLLKEAVLLNSLKHLMVLVPSMEATISSWCGVGHGGPQGHHGPMPSSTMSSMAAGPAGAGPLGSAPGGAGIMQTGGGGPPSGPYSHGHHPLDIGVGMHFAQMVKELRTEYASAVSQCAGRMCDILRASGVTNIKVALSQPMANAVDGGASTGAPYGHHQVSSAAGHACVMRGERERPRGTRLQQDASGVSKQFVDIYILAGQCCHRPKAACGRADGTHRIRCVILSIPNYPCLCSSPCSRETVRTVWLHAGVHESLLAMRAALDGRVYIATGRALWDFLGKDLFEFVEGLQVWGNRNTFLLCRCPGGRGGACLMCMDECFDVPLNDIRLRPFQNAH